MEELVSHGAWSFDNKVNSIIVMLLSDTFSMEILWAQGKGMNSLYVFMHCSASKALHMLECACVT